MSGLTIVTVPTCCSNVHWSRRVEGSKGKLYTVTFGRVGSKEYQYGWTCECLGFQHRGNCKHIVQCAQSRCGWNAEMELVKVENHTCPKCGDKVEYISVGV
jgi:hypothetical protein